jgi:alpha-D-ribose 1-methylphosphonate 5-triphosphate diphosphatase
MVGLDNGLIVTPTRIIEGYMILIEFGRIIDIVPSQKVNHIGQIYNCNGDFLLPGLIDIHSDVIENLIVPRKGIILDATLALYEIDKQLINQGITTMFHSISVANSTICNCKRTLSVPQMLDISRVIQQHSKKLLINHSYHARLELNTLEAYDEIVQMLPKKLIAELSLMNHAPGQGQYSNLTAFKKEIVKQYGNISENEQDKIIDICQGKSTLSKDKIENLINVAHNHHISVAYHDVESIEQVEWLKQLNVNICEFPLNSYVAERAIEMGFHNVVGAPNVLLNQSHNNNASASELLLNGCANILCSDYFSSSLLQAIFTLFYHDNIPLPQAVAFATINPAQAVGIDKDYGSIEIGKIADIVSVNVSNKIARIRYAFVLGHLKSFLNYGEQC